jgi:beta-D-xylosidase 4
MVPHMDTTGSYLPGTPHILTGAAATPAHCQKMCCGEPQCDTFTFDTGQTPSGADCWLKAGGTLTVGGCGVGSKYNCTSGQVRTGHHVGPSPVPGPPGTVEWTSIGKAVVNSTAHQTVAYDAALQSMVMLKNTGVLPLKQGAKVAVIGPFGICQQCYVGPYFGDDICYAPEESLKTRTYDCIPTIASQIAAVNAGGTTTVAEGVAISGSNSSGVAAALALVEAADVVVLAIGIDHSIEHEGKDAPDSALPGLQESFSLQVLAKKKPTVLLLMGNDCNGIDKLIAGSAAIVRGFYPATHGARALASLLFGKANRWGKLPVTMYPHGYLQQLPAMGAHTGTAYSFAQPPGRSYRYYTGTPLFKFGTGLSLTTFNISCGPAVLKAAETSLSAAVPAAAGPPPLPIYRKIIVSCVVSNTGKMVGDGEAPVERFHCLSLRFHRGCFMVYFGAFRRS